MKQVIATLQFNELTENVRAHVVKDQCDRLKKYIRITAIKKEIYEMFKQINPRVEFFVKDGQKLFRVLDDDGRIGRTYGENIASYAKYNPDLMNGMLNLIINKDGN